MTAQRRLSIVHDTSLEDATHKFEMADKAVRRANEALKKAKEELLPLLGRIPSEGTKRVPVNDKVVVVQTRLTRRLDAHKAERARRKLPNEVANRVLPVTYKLSLRDLRYLEKNNPTQYAIVRKAFTATKATPSIKVEVQ